MAKTTSLHELLIDELKDLYSAETQLTKALPKMAQAANDEALKAGFEDHLDQTHEHIARLDRVMELLNASPKGKICKAMKGLVAEGEEKIHEDASPAVKDAALICAAQKVEHYEIAGYGTVRTFAELLGQDQVVELLQETLDEEAETDRKLTELASSLNLKAETGDDADVEEEEESEDEVEEVEAATDGTTSAAGESTEETDEDEELEEDENEDDDEEEDEDEDSETEKKQK